MEFIKYLNSDYTELTDSIYREEKFRLQIELLKLQEWIEKNNKRVAIIFEGRDAAGKGSTIKRFIENLNPRKLRVFELGVPTKKQNRSWFKTHERIMPKAGEMVFFDRSWYSRAMIQPTMGYCTKNQYEYFMKNVIDWEEELIRDGTHIIKIYLSVQKPVQKLRFKIRKEHKLKYWKLSKNDLKTLGKWEEYTYYKNRMFEFCSSEKSPWIIINSNNKMIARLNAMRYVLRQFSYDGKIDLENENWSVNYDQNDLTLFGVYFDNLSVEQYTLLNKLKSNE